MGLQHVVITSVDRDDLPNGGAEAFAECITEIRRRLPDTSVEVLIPDFKGSERALRIVMDARPDILNHNLETAERLYRMARPGGRYDRALELLARARRMAPDGLTKSGIILGMGEEWDELLVCLRDLRRSDVNILTLGQYLRPSASHLPVARYYTPDEFAELREIGLALGFTHVQAEPAHPLVLSRLGAGAGGGGRRVMATTARARPRPRGGLDPDRADLYRNWLRQMLLIRRFEEQAGEAYASARSAASATSTSGRRRSRSGASRRSAPTTTSPAPTASTGRRSPAASAPAR